MMITHNDILRLLQRIAFIYSILWVGSCHRALLPSEMLPMGSTSTSTSTIKEVCCMICLQGLDSKTQTDWFKCNRCQSYVAHMTCLTACNPMADPTMASTMVQSPWNMGGQFLGGQDHLLSPPMGVLSCPKCRNGAWLDPLSRAISAVCRNDRREFVDILMVNPYLSFILPHVLDRDNCNLLSIAELNQNGPIISDLLSFGSNPFHGKPLSPKLSSFLKKIRCGLEDLEHLLHISNRDHIIQSPHSDARPWSCAPSIASFFSDAELYASQYSPLRHHKKNINPYIQLINKMRYFLSKMRVCLPAGPGDHYEWYQEVLSPSFNLSTQIQKTLLVEAHRVGIDINAKNQEGRTVLFFLFNKPINMKENVRNDLIYFLIEHLGADVDVIDLDGFSFPYLAIDNGSCSLKNFMKICPENTNFDHITNNQPFGEPPLLELLMESKLFPFEKKKTIFSHLLKLPTLDYGRLNDKKENILHWIFKLGESDFFQDFLMFLPKGGRVKIIMKLLRERNSQGIAPWHMLSRIYHHHPQKDSFAADVFDLLKVLFASKEAEGYIVTPIHSFAQLRALIESGVGRSNISIELEQLRLGARQKVSL